MAASVWADRNCVLFFLARARASSSVRRTTGEAGGVSCWVLVAGTVPEEAGASWAAEISTRHSKHAATEAQNRTRMRREFIILRSWTGRKQAHGKEECTLTKPR